MNIPHLIATRDAILAATPENFDMKYTISPGHSCGTVACIAGFACLVQDPSANSLLPVLSWARRLLGLTQAQADSLFEPTTYFDLISPADPDLPHGINWQDITPAIAAATIDRLIATGEVKWQI